MKITKEHYQTIKSAIAPLAYKSAPYRAVLGKDNRVKDMDKRVRWDFLYAARISSTISEIYQYANDDHIDTALRSIQEELNL